MIAMPAEMCTNRPAARAGPRGKTSSKLPNAQAMMTSATVIQ